MTSETHYRFEQMVEQNFTVISRSGEEWMCLCPWHDNTGSPALQVNVKKGLYYCFACFESGSMKTAMEHFGKRFADPETSIVEIRDRLDMLEEQAYQPDFKVLPESWLKRYAFPNDYWSSRGFSDTTIAAFQLGYDPLHNYATIPVRTMKGELLGVVKRYIDHPLLKYIYPKRFPRKENLFGNWLAAHDKRRLVVLTEGSVDAMKVWQAGYIGMASYGSTMNRAQIRQLHQLGVDQIVLMYDNSAFDRAGASAVKRSQGRIYKAREGKEVYVPSLDLTRTFRVRSVRWRASMPKDPGDMTEEQIQHAVENAPDLR